MDLRPHIEQLVDRNPLFVNNAIGQNLPALFEIAMHDSQRRGEHEFLKTLLLFLCLMTYISHKEYALLPLRALVGHVLALCPDVKESFDKALRESCPRLHTALSK